MSMLLVPAVVFGALVSGSALPASAEDVTGDPLAPTAAQLAAVDPTQTTVPVEDTPDPASAAVPAEETTDPAPPVEETTEPAAPSTDPETADPGSPDPTTDPATEPAAPTTTAPATPTSPEAKPSVDARVAAPDEITPMLVPPATGNDAVITVKTGGVRTSVNAIGNLPGVVLRLYDDVGGSPAAAPRTDVWATCTSDADGDCSFTVPSTQTGAAGVNRDKRFWIRQSGAPSGYFVNGTLAAGGSSPTSQTYQFRTGAQLRSGTTYRSTADFMLASDNSNDVASGGIWQSSMNNPGLPPKCGLNVALVLDLSGSVAPYINDLKGAANVFVDSLTGTPSSVGLFTFASTAPASGGSNLALTPVSTATGATTVKNRIATYSATGATNWDRGLFQVASSSAAYDVAVVLTDGNPTFYGAEEGPGSRTRFREVENGIFSANAIKAKSTRVIAMGVGAGVSGSPANLVAISGTTAGSDYYQTANYAAAGAALRALALGACQGSVSVVKQVVPSTNTGESVTGAAPAAGWGFTAATSTTGVTPATQSGTTQAGTGAVNFPLTYAGGTTTGTVKIAETQQPGYTLVTQGGKRAVCTNVATGAAVLVTNDATDPNGFSVDVPASVAVSCTVYNRPPQPQASVVVDKEWVVNGVTYTDGNQPSGLSAQLTIAGTNQAWSAPRTGLTVPGTVVLAETTSIVERDLCKVTGSSITQKNGGPVTLPVPSTVTLTPGDTNRYTMTNVVQCDAQLTLVKQVEGGPALPTTWTLDAVAPAGALAGPLGATGTPGATAPVTPQVRYPLVETGGSPLYVQQILTGGIPTPPATGSWRCTQVNAQGVTIGSFNDGINGGVTVPLGYRVSCIAVNQSAQLTLIKQVVNDNGGSKVPADWTLTATPASSVAGVVPQSVAGSTTGSTLQVRPGTTYTLSETGPAGYTQQSLKCNSGEGTPYVDATTVTAAVRDHVTCVFVNDDQGAHLTLVKTVDNGTTGATTLPTAWTLAAAGPTPITGTTGQPAVTAANVNVGTYTLSESGGPAGYTASGWVCTGPGGTLTGASLVLSGGADVTCTVTNTAQQPRLTLVKVVVNGTTGATAAPSAWTLAAAGPTPVTGAGNSPAVTSQPVAVGTYALSETGGPSGYTASGWTCTGATPSSSSVTLGLGANVTCTITNTAVAPTLTLVKKVTTTAGGTAVPTDWTLSFAGPASGSGTTGATSITGATVPTGAYTLGESGGPGGYTASDWVCADGAAPVGAPAGVVTLGLGQHVTCTVTNTDQAARLTLVKEVQLGQTGSVSIPADWTLTATPVAITGQLPVSGNGTGTALGGVHEVSVFSGSYTLSETGPGGFQAGAWSCEGGVLTGSTVSVPAGGTVVCRITNTALSPQLTLVKVVDDGDGAGTAVPTDWTLSATGPTPVSGATGTPTVTAATVKVGTYALAESGPTGYTSSLWTCVQGTQPVTVTDGAVTLAEGQHVTCTVTNTAVAPRLTLVKQVVNGSTGATAVDTDWTLTASGGAAGTLTGVTGDDAITSATAQAATYTLSEAGGPDGYTASGWTCTGAAASSGSTVQLAAGDDATCTITNTAVAPRLTLVKKVENGTTGATTPATAWTLTADGPASLSGTTGSAAVTGAPVTVGTYTLDETGPAGYTSSGWVCDSDKPAGSTVALAAGDDVTCTVTNTAKPSTLTLVKEVASTNGGTAEPGDWTLAAGTVVSGTTGVSETVPVGTYPLSESGGPAGYTLTALVCSNSTQTSVGDANVTVGLGEDVTCTFTNTSQPASIRLTKVVADNGAGLSDAAADWTLSATPDGVAGQDPVSGDGGFPATPVKAGSYDLGETGPGGYDASGWTCELSDGATLDGTTVTLDPGASADCSITNTAQTPRLTLKKVVENTHGGTAVPGSFRLSATGAGAVRTGYSGEHAITDIEVPVGDYTLSELILEALAYKTTDLTCVDGDTDLGTTVADPTVSLELGQDVVCTYVNTDQPGRLTLIKDVAGGDSGTTKTPADWTLTAEPVDIDGQSTVTGNGSGTADGGVLEQEVFSGDYTLSEDGPSGFEAGSWICQGGVVTDGVVTVPNGGNVICTITNTATTPRLTLVKVVDNGDTGGTHEADEWTLTADGPTPVSGTTGDPTVTGAAVKVGTYTLTEAGPDGYTWSDLTCEGGTLDDHAVTLAEGDDVTCTLTNTADAPVWTVRKTSNPASGTTVQPGSQIDYTVTIEHTGGVVPTGVEITDDLTDVLDDADLVGEITASTGTAVQADGTITWTVGTFTGTQTLTYSVKVHDDAFGATLTNVVTPPGDQCEPQVSVDAEDGDVDGDVDPNCTTTHLTPAWVLTKESDPASGSVVDQNEVVTYTLHAENIGEVDVTGATAVDDLSGVLDHAALVLPLDPALSYDAATQKLTWHVPTLALGAEASEVSYAVTVNADAFEQTLHNVVTPGGGGRCPADLPPTDSPTVAADEPDLGCDTTHTTGRLDLTIAKSHADIPEGAVDSGKGQQVDYTLVVTNTGIDTAHGVSVTDSLPAALTYVEGTLVAPDGWTAEFVGGVLVAAFDGELAPGDTATFTYTATVGDVPRTSPTGPHVDLVNTACVATTDTDDNPANDCATDTVKVKSVAVQALAVCVNDTPLVTYSVTPVNVTTLPGVALVWWTQDAFESRDPSILATDTAALLADGASQVDQIPVPAGWAPGDTITGEQLWPGAAVDAAGNPTAWPGWTQQADGTWVLDPSAPFYDLRGATVVEVRVNPSTDSTLVYPPATPDCNANPPETVPPGPTPLAKPPVAAPGGSLPRTGADLTGPMAVATSLLLLGAVLLVTGRRRRRGQTTAVARRTGDV